MTQARFFQVALFFPFAAWCLALLVFSLLNRESNSFILNNLYDAYRVFLPYFIFAALTWKLAARKPYRMLVLMAFVIPIIWGFFFTLCYIGHSYFKEGVIDWKVLCIMNFWATVAAYLFEVIPYVILLAFKNDFKSEFPV
ncbi:MAG: hypothetical protein C0402_10710 [Thermodesulfovibrio sp.]|nr:hypothetical protein [Thermodesulfovibrio sp.]